MPPETLRTAPKLKNNLFLQLLERVELAVRETFSNDKKGDASLEADRSATPIFRCSVHLGDYRDGPEGTRDLARNHEGRDCGISPAEQ